MRTRRSQKSPSQLLPDDSQAEDDAPEEVPHTIAKVGRGALHPQAKSVLTARSMRSSKYVDEHSTIQWKCT